MGETVQVKGQLWRKSQVKVPAALFRDLEGGRDGRGAGALLPLNSPGAWLYPHMGLGQLAACLVAGGMGECGDTSYVCVSQASVHKHPSPQCGACTSPGGLIKGGQDSLLPFSSSLTVSLIVDRHPLLLGPWGGPHSPAPARSRGSSI